MKFIYFCRACIALPIGLTGVVFAGVGYLLLTLATYLHDGRKGAVDFWHAINRDQGA